MHDLLPEKNLSLDGMPIVAQTEELDCKGLNLLLGQQSISLLLPVFLSKTGECAKSWSINWPIAMSMVVNRLSGKFSRISVHSVDT